MLTTLGIIPRDVGFRMPGKFAPPAKCWMLCQQREATSRLRAKPTRPAFGETSATIEALEPATPSAGHEQGENVWTRLSDTVQAAEKPLARCLMMGRCHLVVEIDQPVGWVDWQNSALAGVSCSVYFTNVLDSKAVGKATEIGSIDHYPASGQGRLLP
jgi:hypothetical protein